MNDQVVIHDRDRDIASQHGTAFQRFEPQLPRFAKYALHRPLPDFFRLAQNPCKLGGTPGASQYAFFRCDEVK